MRWPASAETWPASACASVSVRSLSSGATAAVQTKPSSSTGMPCLARRQRRAEDGGELAAAERRRDPQRIVEHGGVARERAARWRRACASRPASSTPVPRPAQRSAAAAEQRRGDRRRRRGVADAHLAEADEIGLRRHGVVAGRDGGEELLLVHRRRFA